jgi:iron(III) transport system ATP-binding protein
VLALFRQKDKVIARSGEKVPHSDRRRLAAATIASGVSLSEVSKSFGERPAVQSFTLDMAPGEILCLLGPSGCGKSTLLRLIAGLEKLDSGIIALGELVVSSPELSMQPEQRGVGLMFQDFALFPHMRVVDNVAFGLRRLGRETARKEALAALARMGLESYADHYPHMLSGGQQQRVALARAIVPRPAVLLMDEPFSGLDGRLRAIVRDETLAILRSARATAIIVTHDPEEAMRLGDRIAVMRAGRLIQVGTAEQLYQRPSDAYVAETFSEVHCVPCRVIGGWAVGPLGRFRAQIGVEGEADLCVRPCEIELVPPSMGTPARVIDVRFLGSDALVELAVQGLETSLSVRLRAPQAPQKGAEIGVYVNPERALVFPRAEASAKRA